MFDQVAILDTAAPIESRITLAYYTYLQRLPPGGSPRIGMASAGAIVLAIVTLIICLPAAPLRHLGQGGLTDDDRSRFRLCR